MMRMAAPFVSGQVALIDSLRRKSDLKQLVDTIDKSSDRLRDARKDDPRLIDILASVDRLN